jgi:agmatinase
MEYNDIIKNFDPNGASVEGSGIFGLPFDNNNAQIIIIPVPWEATVSYGGGTVYGPQAVLEASYQVDLLDPNIKDAWKIGLSMDEIPSYWVKKSEELSNNTHDPKIIQPYSIKLNEWVEEKATSFIDKGKLVATLGGEHSSPYGLIKALSHKYNDISILQIDAHADLRIAFEGFEHSHASIMYNAIKLPQIKKLVQVGIRDYCEEEYEIIQNDKRIKTFFDQDIKAQQYNGKTWHQLVQEIIQELGDNVYISMDIDGLDPKLCPNTGTPVPGGFEFEEIIYLYKALVASGRKIIGFDLSEVTPGDNEWDGNVGARMLYRMCNFMAKSNQLC